VLAHVTASNLVRDALITEGAQQPVEDFGGVMLPDRVLDPAPEQIGSNIADE
jgi:hypothetical protein